MKRFKAMLVMSLPVMISACVVDEIPYSSNTQSVSVLTQRVDAKQPLTPRIASNGPAVPSLKNHRERRAYHVTTRRPVVRAATRPSRSVYAHESVRANQRVTTTG